MMSAYVAAFIGDMLAGNGRDNFLANRNYRKDGSTIYCEWYHSALFNSSGELVSVRSQVLDVTQRKKAEEALRQREARLQGLFTQAMGGIAEVDSSGRFTLVNKRYCRIVGYTPDELMTMRMQDITHPDDLADNVELFQKLIERGESFTVEKRYVRKDGSEVWVNSSVAPVRDAEGQVQSAVAMVFDITDRKHAEEHRTMLLHGLNHRVKNTLTIVQAIATQTFKSSELGEDATRAFRGRLTALSSVHDILTCQSWASADLLDIIDKAVAPYCEISADRFQMDGPQVRLTPRAALAMAMGLHELCTNAAKYGALSLPEGQVQIKWTIANSENLSYLRLRWEEVGGPDVESPKRKGFGSRLLERLLSDDLRANIALDYRREGVICSIEAPLQNISVESDLDDFGTAVIHNFDRTSSLPP